MILSFGVSLELRAIEINFPQVAGAIALGFVVEMRGGGMSAFAARSHGLGAHTFAELDHRDKAISAGAVPFLRSRVGTRSEGRERSPLRRSEADRNARSRVAEGLDDIAGEPLESIYVAPLRLPVPEVGREFVASRGERL